MKKIISLLIITTMFVSTIPISFAETNTSNNIENESEVLSSKNNLPIDDEPVNFDDSFTAKNDADYAVAENIVPEEERLENIASGGVVLTPDESVLNDPVMTPENRAKLEAYEAMLMEEMEEDGYSINNDISLMAESTPTFEQYLADYNYNFNCYPFYKNDFKLPYRSFVETKQDNAVWQGLVGAWRVATFNLSDVSKYSNKEIGFYEAVLFDVLYQGKDVESISGMMQDTVNTVQPSLMKKISVLLNKSMTDMVGLNLSDLSDDEFNKMSECIQTCDELKDVFGAIGNVSDWMGYASDVEELIYKLAKAQVIAATCNDSAKILLTMKNNTSNPAMQKALDNMILICSEQTSDAAIFFLLSSDKVLSETFNTVLGDIWSSLLEQLTAYGYAVSAGQAAGKALSGWLFSTDENVEMYYNICALYEFEDTLKIAMNTYERSYLSSKSDGNSKTFNECYKMLLRTFLYGAKLSQKYVDVLYTHGLINELLFCFHEEDYNAYSKALSSITKDIELTIKFMDTVAYNSYLEEYCPDYVYVSGINKKDDEYSPDEKLFIIDSLNKASFETNNIVIDSDMTLSEDLNTYGSVYITNGIVDLNGHTFNVGGNVLQSGGNITLNGGKLKITGDYIIAGSISTDSVGTKTYTPSDGTLYMTDVNDYIEIGGDFYTKAPGSTLTNGTMVLNGDFEQSIGRDSYFTYVTKANNFDAKDNHKIIFNGTEQQNITFENAGSSGFANVEFKNKNIKLNSMIRGFTLNDDIELSIGTDYLGISGTMYLNGHSLNSGYLYNGDLNITSGTLDLGGSTISINGNVHQSGGNIYFHGGKLNVTGDYVLADEIKTDSAGNKTYTAASASITMTDVSDYMSIDGDFIFYGGCQLTRGAIEIKGDFKADSFSAQENHTVIFSGTAQQSIFFANNTRGGFANVKFNNKNIRLDSGIRGFTLNDDIELTIGVDYLNINGTLNLNGHILNSGYVRTGDLTIQSGSIDFAGSTISINGNVLQSGGNITLNGGKLKITGDYIIAGSISTDSVGTKTYTPSDGTLSMTDVNDYIEIGGDFYTKAPGSTLTNGTMVLNGDFEQSIGRDSYFTYVTKANNFDAKDNHKIIFNGTEQQNITFENASSSGFANMKINNKTGPVTFSTAARVSSTLTQPGGAEIQGRENVTLQNKPAFEDHGAENAAINKYVGNAENVIPTWKDYEAYINGVTPEPTSTPTPTTEPTATPTLQPTSEPTVTAEPVEPTESPTTTTEPTMLPEIDSNYNCPQLSFPSLCDTGTGVPHLVVADAETNV